jgi:DHA1 family multidrug resistance protein-like MFS transporter
VRSQRVNKDIIVRLNVMMIAFITTLLFVKEQFNASVKKVHSAKEVWALLPDSSLIIMMFATAFVLVLSINRLV